MSADLALGARTRAADATTERNRQLPAWPLVGLFAGFGLWWALGLGAFAVAIMATPMTVLLLCRGGLRFPRGFWLWVIFVAWAAAAALEVEGGLRYIGFGVRLAGYIGATIVFLYVYNSSRERLPDRTLVLTMVAFAATVVVGGWLGVLFPHVRLSTPFEMVLPGSVRSNSYVQALVRPSFAEIQTPYGSPVPFARPSAPFPYSNGWGCNMALLVPFATAAFGMVSRRGRIALGLLLAAALVPALATLNRGMYIAIAFGLAYAVIRYAMRGRLRPAVALATSAAVALSVAWASGVFDSLETRLQYSGTNTTRLLLYEEAFHGAFASPLFGNGSPRPSSILDISVGTQGALWSVMYSYGFVALACYLGWFVYAAVRSSPGRDGAELWTHVVVMVVLLTTWYYGYDGPELAVAMVASAIALRPGEPS